MRSGNSGRRKKTKIRNERDDGKRIPFPLISGSIEFIEQAEVTSRVGVGAAT
jgi:hypothetical protein